MRHYQPAVPAQSFLPFEAVKKVLRSSLGFRSLTKGVPVRMAEAARSDTQKPGVRTDDDIERECKNALAVTVPGPNQAITVMVSNGWVRLSGDVAWGYERWIAEAIVCSLMGVVGVNSQIKVRPPVVESDADANIEAALYRQPEQEFHDIETKVDRDQVSLSNTVHSWAEAELRVMRPGPPLG